MDIIFRCDCNSKIGLGHFIRCSSLAEKFKEKGLSCAIIGPEEKFKKLIPKDTFLKWIPKKYWGSEEEDAKFLIKKSEELSSNFLILDDYRIQEIYQSSLSRESKKWMQFDKWPEKKIWADLIINANPSAKKGDYKEFMQNADAEILLGPDYALLRKEFSLRRINNPCEKNVVRSIFLFFGGGDDKGVTLQILKYLVDRFPKGCYLNIVSGLNNPNNDFIKLFCDKYLESKANFFINPPNIDKIISNCDVAITSGGTVLYEIASQGLPMLIISNAQNQVKQSFAWQELGAAIYLGDFLDLNLENFFRGFSKLLEDELLIQSMSKNALSAVDGLGTERVSEIIISKFF